MTLPQSSTISSEEYAAQQLAESLDNYGPIAEATGESGNVASCASGFDGLHSRASLILKPEVRLQSGLDMRRVVFAAGTSFTALTIAFLLPAQSWLQSPEAVPTRSEPAPVTRPVIAQSPTSSIQSEPRQSQPPSRLVSSERSINNAAAAPNNVVPNATQGDSTFPVSSGAQQTSPRLSGESSASNTVNSRATFVSGSSENAVASGNTFVPVTNAADSNVSSDSADISEQTSSEPKIVATDSSSPSDSGTVSWRSTARIAPKASSAFTSVRVSSDDSQHEIERMSLALDAGGNNGRDTAELYQQRALIYLNQSDYEHATEDFMHAIDAFKIRIQTGDRTAAAKAGLIEAQKGLKQASHTFVY